MRGRELAMIGVAATAGLGAVGLTLFASRVNAPATSLAQRADIPATTIVVAARPLRFGDQVADISLREVAWPGAALPANSFHTKAELFAGGDKRIALSAIEIDEPILKSKITGPGQRATLSSLVSPGKRAVAIHIDDVLGVGGFILPGDRVDVVFVRNRLPGGAPVGNLANDAYSSIILQDARVLGIDQTADDRSDKPKISRTATLEVDALDAERLQLAASMGQLSLALRPAGPTQVAPVSKVFGAEFAPDATPADAQSTAAPDPVQSKYSVTIRRGLRAQDYKFTSTLAQQPEVATTARGRAALADISTQAE